MHPVRVAIALALVLVGACVSPATELLVVVDSDFSAPGELGMVRAGVLDPLGNVLSSHDFEIVSAGRVPPPGGARGLPFSFAVVPRAGESSSAEVTIVLDGYDAAPPAGRVIVQRRAIVAFQPGRTLAVPMRLERVCRDHPCPTGMTCSFRLCVSAVVPAASLVEALPGSELGRPRDGGVVDSSLDRPDLDVGSDSDPGADAAGTPDAGGCPRGFADCDGDAANGCEADLGRDPAHCGACSTTCASDDPLRGPWTCFAGVCRQACTDGRFADCDGVASNGCEVDLRADRMHCGGCATECPPDNIYSGPWACVAGGCRQSCTGGRFVECDGNFANGCEDLGYSITNCGACGVVCPSAPAHSHEFCITHCQYLCDDPWRDCDGLAANGCEVDVRGNPLNCRGCGVVCPVGTNCRADGCS